MQFLTASSEQTAGKFDVPRYRQTVDFIACALRVFTVLFIAPLQIMYDQ
jgi:hypothetical protein